MSRLTVSEKNLEQLFGTRDEHLRYLEERLGVSVSARGGEVQLHGEEAAELVARRVLESFDRMISSGGSVSKEEFRTGVRVLEEDPQADLVEFFLDASVPASLKRFLVPRNLNQRRFIRSVYSHDCAFVTGPAGFTTALNQPPLCTHR